MREVKQTADNQRENLVTAVDLGVEMDVDPEEKENLEAAGLENYAAGPKARTEGLQPGVVLSNCS